MTTWSSSRHRSPSQRMETASIRGVMSHAWWMVAWLIRWLIGSYCSIQQARKTRWRTLRRKVRIFLSSVRKTLLRTKSSGHCLPRPPRKNSTQTQDGLSKSTKLLPVLTTLRLSLRRWFRGRRKWMSWSIWTFCRGRVKVRAKMMSWKGMIRRMSALALRRSRSRYLKSHWRSIYK